MKSEWVIWVIVWLSFFVVAILGILSTSEPVQPEPIYITVTQIVEVEVPVIVEKEKVLVFFWQSITRTRSLHSPSSTNYDRR